MAELSTLTMKPLVTLQAVLLLALAAAPVAAQPRDAGAPAGKHPATEKPSAPCKPPRDRTLIRFTLGPDAEVADLITWYATTTCTGILMSSGSPLAGKKVTILAPEPITFAELRRLFNAALDSVGLVAEPDGKFLRIIDARRARPARP
jgi:hypothetical protein